MQPKLQEVILLYGLYDQEGLLRYLGIDREACLAYADLFNMQSFECAYMPAPTSKLVKINGQEKRLRQVANNN